MLMEVKNNQGKKVQLRGVVRRILALKLKKAKETLMELLKTVMEIMSLEKILKNPVPMKILMVLKNNQGKLVELRGVVRRMVVMKEKKMMSRQKKGANNDGDDEESGKENERNGYGVDERGDGDNSNGDNCEISSANENNDGGKEQSGKDGVTEGIDNEDNSDD
jgi:hypothetical protein